jgi:hypothetical protein
MRPRKPRPQDKSPGSRLRDALADKQAADQTEKQDTAAREQDAFRGTLSKWFNDVAAELPQTVKDITASLERHLNVSTDLSYAAEDKISVRGVTGVELETLAGFKALDQACRDLDIQCSVTADRYGYSRKSTAGQEYLHVNIDVSQPYQPIEAQKAPRRHGPRFR